MFQYDIPDLESCFHYIPTTGLDRLATLLFALLDPQPISKAGFSSKARKNGLLGGD